LRKGRYLTGAVLGLLGALCVESEASAVPVSQSLQATISPAKQPKKAFGGASLHTVISTTFDSFATSESPKQTVFTIDPNIKFTNGNVPPCQLGQIQNKPTAQAQASCPQSIVGTGGVQVNGGALVGTVTIFAGGPGAMYVQTDVNNGSVILTIIGTLSGRTLAFTNIPNTPGLVLSNFDVTFNKRRVGTKKGIALFYVSARCKSKRWTSSETTVFYSGEALSASATQGCKVGKEPSKAGGGKGGKRGKGKKRPKRRAGDYVGKTTQDAIAGSFRRIEFTVTKKGKVILTTEPTVGRQYCVTAPVFTIGGATARKKLSRNGTFTFTRTFFGNKLDKIHGRFVGTDEVKGYVNYHFFAQSLCSAGNAKIPFTAKRQ
jgi:hypothetical protein